MSTSHYPYPLANNGQDPIINGSGNGSGNGSASLNPQTPVRPSPDQIAHSSLVPGQAQSLRPNGQSLMGRAQELNGRLAAYQTYQATMQQFLASQERVISQFLTLTPGVETFTPASMAAPEPHRFSPDSPVMGSIQGSLPIPRPMGPMQPLGSTLPVARIDSPSSASVAAPVSPSVSAPVSVLVSGVSPTLGAAPVAVPMSASKAVPSPMPSEAATVASEQLPVNAQVTPLSREEMTQLLLDLVSDRTGYPTDMLGLDQDIEAELGIDSIKRVEIFGSLQKSLPSAFASQLQGKMETLTRLKTLEAVIDQVLTLFQSAASQEADCLGKSRAAADSLPRFTMHPRVLSVPALQQTTLTGLYLITMDSLGVAPLVAQALTAQGAQITLLADSILADPTQLQAAVETARQQGGAIQGLLHLAPLGSVPALNSEGWQQQTQAHVKALFHLLQACAANLQSAEQPRILAVSGSGGHFGRTGPSQPHSVSGGGHTGLLKTLTAEWPQVHCRAIDCDPSQSAATLAQQILTEVQLIQSPVEIGWAAGQRLAFATVASPLVEASQTICPEADWVVLVSGGHRGITAEVLKTLIVPGMTLIIVGRSPEPAPESPATQSCQDLTQLRQALVSQARQQGQAVSPASIEKALQTCLNQRETRANLTWFRQSAQVDYRAVDVQNPEAFAQLIEDIYQQYGRLDAVIHGAGTIADKLLLDKTPATFDQVFDTKANSAFILQQSLRFDALKLLVFFSSVAGRYGSRGQCDYAAANELVNRLAWQLHWQWPHLRVVSLNWGPWDTTGMASPEVKRQFRERGIIPIPLAAGCAFFRQEILFGSRDDVEVIAGEGPWASLDSGMPSPSEEISASEQPGLPPYPLLAAWPQVQPDSTVILDQALTLQSDPYLADHCLDGKPVLPAAVAAEWLAECVQAAWPDQTVVEVADLQVLRGLVVPATGVTVRFSGRASSHVDLLSLEVLAELLDPDNQRPYYRAVIRLQPTTMPMASIPESSSGQVPLSGQALSPQVAYRDYLFHGPAFQLAIAINAITPEGIDAQVVPSRCRDFKPTAAVNSQWLFDPGLVDVVPQLAIVWARVLHNTTPLPARIGRLQRYGTAPVTSPLQLHLRIKDYQTSSLIYDAYIRDSTGVRLVMTGVEGSCSPALNRLAHNVKGDPG